MIDEHRRYIMLVDWGYHDFLSWLLYHPFQEWKDVAHDATDALSEMVGERIVNNGFRAYNNTLKWSRTELGCVTMLTLSTAGRCLIKLERGEEEIFFIYDDSYGTEKLPLRIGLQNIGTRLIVADDMVREACTFWEGLEREDKIKTQCVEVKPE